MFITDLDDPSSPDDQYEESVNSEPVDTNPGNRGRSIIASPSEDIGDLGTLIQ